MERSTFSAAQLEFEAFMQRELASTVEAFNRDPDHMPDSALQAGRLAESLTRLTSDAYAHARHLEKRITPAQQQIQHMCLYPGFQESQASRTTRGAANQAATEDFFNKFFGGRTPAPEPSSTQSTRVLPEPKTAFVNPTVITHPAVDAQPKLSVDLFRKKISVMTEKTWSDMKLHPMLRGLDAELPAIEAEFKPIIQREWIFVLEACIQDPLCTPNIEAQTVRLVKKLEIIISDALARSHETTSEQTQIKPSSTILPIIEPKSPKQRAIDSISFFKFWAPHQSLGAQMGKFFLGVVLSPILLICFLGVWIKNKVFA